MLTDVKARSAKPREKRYRLMDTDGLMLEVRSNGSKSWVLRYTEDGKRKDKTLGAYPALSLREARQAAADALLSVARGERPFASPVAAHGFAAVGAEFLASKEPHVRASYLKKMRERMNRYLLPRFGQMNIRDVRVSDARDLLLEVAKTRPDTAQKLYALLSEMYRFAALREYVDGDPIAPLKGLIKKPAKKHLAYITDRQKLGEVLRLIEQSTASIPVALELQILPHVFVRPSELRLATWDEFDLDAALWKIPAARMKMGRVHWVPLSRQVLALLHRVRVMVGDSGYLFPGARYGRPHSDVLLNIALKNLGIGSNVIVPHGFRHTASTMLHELGFEHAHIEKQLAHESGNAISAVYNHAEYLDARRQMMQSWSDFLDELRAQ